MRSNWVVVPTLGVAWIAFAQVVSFQGLAIWVIGGSVLTVLVISALSSANRHRRSLIVVALLAGVAMTAVVAFLTETLGGNEAGPVTRAALMTSGCAAAMSWILHTRYPAALLFPALLLIGGALGLGAAEQIPWLVGMWLVAAAVTLAALGPYTRTDLAHRRRLIPFGWSLLVAGVIGVIALLAVGSVLSNPWTIPGAGDPVSAISTDSTVVTESDPIVPAEAVSDPSQADSVVEQVINSVISWLAILALVLILLLLIVSLLQVSWWLWVAWRWRRWRRRMNRGTPEERCVGAWNYVRLRRARFDNPLPLYASPDVAAELASNAGESAIVEVARGAALVAFNPEAAVNFSIADAAWTAVSVAGRRPHGSWRDKWRWRNRSPHWVHKKLVRTAASPSSLVSVG